MMILAQPARAMPPHHRSIASSSDGHSPVCSSPDALTPAQHQQHTAASPIAAPAEIDCDDEDAPTPQGPLSYPLRPMRPQSSRRSRPTSAVPTAAASLASPSAGRPPQHRPQQQQHRSELSWDPPRLLAPAHSWEGASASGLQVHADWREPEPNVEDVGATPIAAEAHFPEAASLAEDHASTVQLHPACACRLHGACAALSERRASGSVICRR